MDLLQSQLNSFPINSVLLMTIQNIKNKSLNELITFLISKGLKKGDDVLFALKGENELWFLNVYGQRIRLKIDEENGFKTVEILGYYESIIPPQIESKFLRGLMNFFRFKFIKHDYKNAIKIIERYYDQNTIPIKKVKRKLSKDFFSRGQLINYSSEHIYFELEINYLGLLDLLRIKIIEGTPTKFELDEVLKNGEKEFNLKKYNKAYKIFGYYIKYDTNNHRVFRLLGDCCLFSIPANYKSLELFQAGSGINKDLQSFIELTELAIKYYEKCIPLLIRTHFEVDNDFELVNGVLYRLVESHNIKMNIYDNIRTVSVNTCVTKPKPFREHVYLELKMLSRESNVLYDKLLRDLQTIKNLFYEKKPLKNDFRGSLRGMY